MGPATNSMRTYVVTLLGFTYCPAIQDYPQNTNIVQFCATLKKDDRDQQMVYYQVRLTCL